MTVPGTVFLLAMLEYNSLTHEIASKREMSWHVSHSDCILVMQAEQDRGRRESHNHMYVCLPVVDYEMRDLADAGGRSNYPRTGYASTNLRIQW